MLICLDKEKNVLISFDQTKNSEKLKEQAADLKIEFVLVFRLRGYCNLTKREVDLNYDLIGVTDKQIYSATEYIKKFNIVLKKETK